MSSRRIRPFARLFAAKAQHRWRFVSAENAPRYATIAERRGDAGVMRPNLLGIVGMTSARCSGDRGSKQLRTNSRLSPMLARVRTLFDHIQKARAATRHTVEK